MRFPVALVVALAAGCAAETDDLGRADARVVRRTIWCADNYGHCCGDVSYEHECAGECACPQGQLACADCPVFCISLDFDAGTRRD